MGGHAGRCQHLARVGPGVEKVECGEKYFRILSITTDFALVRGGGYSGETKIGVMENSLDGWGVCLKADYREGFSEKKH